MSLLRSLPTGALLVCGLLPFAPTGRASQLIDNLQQGNPQTIVVYGTSLTEGGQWVPATAAWLTGQYPGLVTMINSGMSGRASNTAVANLQTRVIAHAPDTVFIEFAMNDAFTAYATNDIDYGITVAKSQENLNLMIDAILQAKPGTEIILQTMNQPWDAPNGNLSASKRPDLAAYYDGYRQVAANRGLLLIDHHVNWLQLQASNSSQYQAYIPDGVHPSSTGSTAITVPEIQRVIVLSPANTAPTGLTATSGDGRITLAWYGVMDATRYTVKHAATRDGVYAPLATDLTTTGYIHTGLANGVTRYYRVSATDADGEGPDSDVAIATPFAQVVITQDNTDSSGVSLVGTWTGSALAGYYGTNSIFAAANSGATAQFTPTIAVAGHYAVHARWTANSNRATNTPFTLAHADGTVTLPQNQRLNHATWMPLGTYRFEAGAAGSVSIGTSGVDGIVIADAVRFTLQPPTTLSVVATADARESGCGAGSFTVTRQAHAYTAPLSVFYTLGGTAANGADYAALSGAAIIPAGFDAVTLSVAPLADTLGEGAETVVLTLSSDSEYTLTGAASAQIAIEDRPVDNWKVGQFTAGQLADPLISGDLADPDGDGHPNLIEYAFGFHALTPDPPALSAAILDDHLTLAFPRRRSATELNYVPEVCATLLDDWAAGDGVVEQTVIGDLGDGFDLVLARDRSVVGADPARFLRLKVSLP